MSTSNATLESVELCARPLARRLYKTVVVGLAVFLVTLIAFKQDFRGYLAEARLSGPVLEGLDLNAATEWIKNHDSNVAAVANRPAANPGKAQLRITYIAMQPQVASARVEELAERWLYQYLPDRLQAYRQEALAEHRKIANAARQREDEARHQLDVLRQTQLTQLQGKDNSDPATPAILQQPPQTGSEIESRNAVIQKLADLRLAMGALSGERTDEHPRVQKLKLEAAALEQQLGLLPGQPLQRLSAPAPPQYVSHSIADLNPSQRVAEIAALISAALAELSAAASDRQAADFCLSERMQDLAQQNTSVNWSKSAAVSIARLGGTPRCSTLTLAGLLACAAGIMVFRAGRFEIASCSLQSTTQLASSLEIPVLGDLASLRGFVTAKAARLLSPRRTTMIVRVAEGVVAIATFACLVAIAFEPSLARQVLADPFGALSEVLGRFGI
jgi:hypothetical protein